MFSVADLTYENLTQLQHEFYKCHKQRARSIKSKMEMMKMELKDMMMIQVGVIHAKLLQLRVMLRSKRRAFTDPDAIKFLETTIQVLQK